MRVFLRSDAFYLLAFFSMVIAIGALLLLVPGVWLGTSAQPGPLKPIDALFTATSAVCVTGLITVDTAGYSRIGQVIIVALIQIGGLGIISFTSILLTIPGRRLPLRRLNTIRGFYIDGVEYNPVHIVRNIVALTLTIEALGAIALAIFFRNAGIPNYAFAGIFHSISAFCNAGFSIFSLNLEEYYGNVPILVTIMILIVSGGLGFIVLQDLYRWARLKRHRLSYHSKVVLFMTGMLITVGTLLFFLIERPRQYREMNIVVAGVNALFQAITPRTAGFDTVPQGLLSQPSKLLTLLLMLIGGAPGSIAGGIKVTTAFVVAVVMFRRPDRNGDITLARHRLPAQTINDGIVYFLKAIALLLTAVLALSLTEGLRGIALGDLAFEVVSAFGTVGLSVGLTASLSTAGKLVIIATMFAGRVGLIALAFPSGEQDRHDITFPRGNILLG